MIAPRPGNISPKVYLANSRRAIGGGVYESNKTVWITAVIYSIEYSSLDYNRPT
jgi:hypothetical protein